MQKIRGLAKVTASLSLACGIAAAAAGPALAASPNEAYAAQATGPISAGPLDEATFPGTSPVSVNSDSIAGLLTAGLITDRASATGASTSVANVGVTLAAATALLTAVSLTADAVTSQCTFDPNTDTVSGSATITNGTVNGGLISLISLAADPAKDTTVTVPGVATLTLNRQTTATDGTLTVDAIYVSLLNSTQTLSIGTSVCNTATLAGAPALPGVATPIGATLAGLVGFSGIGYFLNRRRRVASQG
jgi:hypothetical protein